MGPLKHKPGAWCSAPRCKNNSVNNQDSSSDVSFFRFPKDPERCKQWVINSRREDLLHKNSTYLYNSNRLCADHFTPNMFQANSRRNGLVKYAIPTVFDWPCTFGEGSDPEDLQDDCVVIDDSTSDELPEERGNSFTTACTLKDSREIWSFASAPANFRKALISSASGENSGEISVLLCGDNSAASSRVRKNPFQRFVATNEVEVRSANECETACSNCELFSQANKLLASDLEEKSVKLEEKEKIISYLQLEIIRLRKELEARKRKSVMLDTARKRKKQKLKPANSDECQDISEYQIISGYQISEDQIVIGDQDVSEVQDISEDRDISGHHFLLGAV